MVCVYIYYVIYIYVCACVCAGECGGQRIICRNRFLSPYHVDYRDPTQNQAYTAHAVIDQVFLRALKDISCPLHTDLTLGNRGKGV